MLAKGVDLKKVKEIGYRELAEYIEEGGDLDAVLEDIRKKTRNYAKRQLTWFKNKMDCVFVEMDYRNPEMTEKKIKELLADFLRRD